MTPIRPLFCAAACLLAPSFALASIVGPEGQDLFAEAAEIVGTNVRAPANVQEFTREANEPVLGTGSSDYTAWWKWTPAESGYCIIESAPFRLPPSVPEVLLGVFTGNNLAALIPQGEVSQITHTARTTRVIFFANAGVEYRIAATPTSISGPGYLEILLRQVVPSKAQWEGPWANGFKAGDGQGYLSLTTTTGGTLSGKLTVDGKVYPFKGPWNIDGRFVASFRRPSRRGTPPLPAGTLTIDLAQERDTLRYKVDEGGAVSDGLVIKRAELSSKGNAPHSGTYTLASGTEEGLGYGGLALSVKKNGATKVVGALPDGTAVSFGGWLSQYETEQAPESFVVPFYKSLFKNTGFFLGYVAVAENGSTAGGLPSVYARPPAPDKTFLPQGLEKIFTFSGKRYTPPARGERASGFLDSSSGAGNLVLPAVPNEITDVSEPVAFTERNKFMFQNKRPHRPSLKFNTKTGMVTGSITEPAGKKRKLFGILVEDDQGAKVVGHATGITTTVPFTVIPVK